MEASYTYVTDFVGVEAALARLRLLPVVGFDTETTGLSPTKHKLLLVQLADRDHCWVFDIQRLLRAQSVCGELGRALGKVLAGREVLKLVQNAPFDCGFVREQLDIEVQPLVDTRQMEIRLRPEGNRNSGTSLHSLAQKYAGVDLNKSITMSFCSDPVNFSPEQLAYAALDAQVLFPVWDALFEATNRALGKGAPTLVVEEVPEVVVLGPASTQAASAV